MYKSKKGWYKLQNPNKFKKAFDSYMASFNESTNSEKNINNLYKRSSTKASTLKPILLKF